MRPLGILDGRQPILSPEVFHMLPVRRAGMEDDHFHRLEELTMAEDQQPTILR